MKFYIPIASVIAIALIIYNATKLNFDALFVGDSFTAIITIIAALCALVLLQILRISKKIERLQKGKK
ncbi:MAG: hypothetical protein ED556_01635 [Winogradskyella sp.]|uniref:hypothetical protein n=1 Tax=Winogradskyella sp. TaxID=1883156 RepID=UPI000F4091FE|nr:hypothetical protein [Winogradskyella sp.]RNC87918.1 MAG: hypothetical protein ED556_01635 [Winogradskyella sp.]